MASKNTPPTAAEGSKIEKQLAAMLDARKAKGGIKLSTGQVEAWAGTRVTADGKIAARDEPGVPYPVVGLYRGLFAMASRRKKNPYYYAIETTVPTFAKVDGETQVVEAGTLVGYGFRKTLDLTSLKDGDEVSILPAKQKKTRDGEQSYWLFEVEVVKRRAGAPDAPNARLAPLPANPEDDGRGEEDDDPDF